MLLESDLYIRECERRFELQRAELLIKRGIAEEIDRAGFGLPDWLTAPGRGLRRRLTGRARPATQPDLHYQVSSASGREGQRVAATAATSEGVNDATPAAGRLCAGEHRRKSVVCDDCGAVIRRVTPACSTTARRTRTPGDAAHRQTV